MQCKKRIDPHEAFHTLGVVLTPNGSCEEAFECLVQITLHYATAVTASHLTRDTALTSYVQHLLPKIRYPLPALSLTYEQCQKLNSIALQSFLQKSISIDIPHAILYLVQ
jgi:hypothetical protein